MPKKTFKFPKSMALCADRYYTLRQKRLAMQKEVAEVEEEEKALKEHIIQNLPKSEATGAAGKLARVTIKPKLKPSVTDWPALMKYIRGQRGQADDLLQHRVSDAAVEARWEQNKTIPGIEKFDVITLSVNKV